ncbi:MAG: TetR/AcrR family transcriptional regulator [Ilumatobacteraceae bacterium]
MTERRIALLDAAIEEIAQRGTRGLRIELVAARAGVSTALIYHHFGDRSTLLHAALEHVGERAAGYTDHRLGTGREQLLTMLANEIQDDEAVRTNSTAWGELRDAAVFDQSLRPTIEALTDRWAAAIAAIVRVGQADGSIATDLEPHQLGVCLSALAEGISGRWLTGLLSAQQARTHLTGLVAAILHP